MSITDVIRMQGRVKVLVVDDDRVVRTLIRRIMEDEGFEVSEAEDGEAALEVYRRSKPEVVISDIKMPKLTGLELLAKLKRIAPDVCVILISAFADIEAALEALHEGADDLIPKPFSSPAVVAESISRAMKRRSDAAELAMLRNLNTAKDEFISLFSHELRTPLTSLVGSLDVLKAMKDEVGDDASEMIDVAEDSLRRLRHVVETIFFVSHFSQASVYVQNSPYVPSQIAESVKSRIAPEAAKRGIRIENQVQDSGAAPKGDRELLELALYHLLDNAVKFSECGSTVRIEVEDDGNRVKFIVSDNGPGIPEDKQVVVFDSFVKLGKTMVTGSVGPGLGLTLVRYVAQAHKGKVEMKSEPGRGTTVAVSLPMDPKA
ncbi:MAG: hybrid sensor histidine kinase/response regulator [Planctomycetes bacterium]|nr:hybrid sensor histidine kinase/response regulator [Planctomycetota bacterium]